MSAETVKSSTLTDMDANIILLHNAGNGAPGREVVVDDWVAVTAVGIGSSGSIYKLARFPTNAIIKSLVIASDVPIDSNATQTLAFKIGVLFSDSTTDGTPQAYQGLAPITTANGAPAACTVASANNLFGTVTLAGATAGTQPAIARTDVTFNGTNATYSFVNITSLHAYELFGYLAPQTGLVEDPGGSFEIYLTNSVKAATGAAGNIYAKLTYVLG